MPLPTDARTGFDLELQLRGTFVRQLLQLLMDTGVIPSSFEIPSIFNPGETVDVLIAPAPEASINRLYEASPDFTYPPEDSAAFLVSFLDYPELEGPNEFVYFNVRVMLLSGTPIDLIGRIAKTIDVQGLAAAFVDYDPEDETSNPPRLDQVFNLESILIGEGLGFDPLNPTTGMIPQVITELESIQETITNLGRAIVEEEAYEDVLDFMIGQADPLGLVRLDTVHLRRIDSQQLALCSNLVLLSNERGYVPSRGSIALLENILPEAQDIAFATGPQLLPNIFADILTKLNLIIVDENEGLSNNALDLRLLDDRFPLRIEDDLLREWLGMELDEGDPEKDLALSAYVTDISTDTAARSFKDPDGNKIENTTLRYKVECNAYLADLFGTGSANLLLDIYPLTAIQQGKAISDLTIRTNARADFWRGLLTVTGIIPTVIGAIVDIFTNADEVTIPLSSLANLPLVDVPLVRKRWDPFYTTLHTLLFEVDEHAIESNRFGFSATVNLGKRYDPFYNIYLRDIDLASTQIDRLRFRVEARDSILPQLHYAADRAPFIYEENDNESGIYSLAAGEAPGSAVERLTVDKFYGYKLYSPYCTTPDTEESRIAAIGLLSDEEESDLYRNLERIFVDNKVSDLISGIENIINRELSEEERAEMEATVRPTFEDSGELTDYLERGIENDFIQSVYTPGKIRLKPSPDHLHQLINQGVLQLRGYVSVVREGERYFRGKADRSEDNNLLSLPSCPIVSEEG